MLSYQAYCKIVDHSCRVWPGLNLAAYAWCSALDGRNTPCIPDDYQTPYVQHSLLIVQNLDERSEDLEKVQGLYEVFIKHIYMNPVLPLYLFQLVFLPLSI